MRVTPLRTSLTKSYASTSGAESDVGSCDGGPNALMFAPTKAELEKLGVHAASASPDVAPLVTEATSSCSTESASATASVLALAS